MGIIWGEGSHLWTPKNCGSFVDSKNGFCGHTETIVCPQLAQKLRQMNGVLERVYELMHPSPRGPSGSSGLRGLASKSFVLCQFCKPGGLGALPED